MTLALGVAPSTLLRMVLLPRFAGEDFAIRKRLRQASPPMPPSGVRRDARLSTGYGGGGGGPRAARWRGQEPSNPQ